MNKDLFYDANIGLRIGVRYILLFASHCMLYANLVDSISSPALARGVGLGSHFSSMNYSYFSRYVCRYVEHFFKYQYVVERCRNHTKSKIQLMSLLDPTQVERKPAKKSDTNVRYNDETKGNTPNNVTMAHHSCISIALLCSTETAANNYVGCSNNRR
jgi:hypothetical protein